MIFKLLDTEIPIVEYYYDTTELEMMFDNLQDSFYAPSSDHKLASLDKRKISDSNEFKINSSWKELEKAFNYQKEHLVKTFIENDNKGRYPKNVVKEISKSLTSYILPSIDYPGFQMDYHLDTRLSFCQGFLNVVENESLTSFKTSKDGKEIFKCSGKKNIGYFWLNTENSYHAVDIVTKKRKIILFNILFVPF
jgi:hypothetical protein